MTVLGLEAGHDVGGVWYWNKYPGARCDVESLEYSYSFDDQIQDEWVWTERFASQPELQRYLSFVADKLDLRRSFEFERRVVSTVWDESSQRWTVTDDHGTARVATYLIMATGILSAPKPHGISGLDDFTGEVYHTATWPDREIDFTGKRVAVIGTGSSAVQAIPLIAEEADRLYVLQRTPSFSLPAQNRALRQDEIDAFAAKRDEVRARARYKPGGIDFVTTGQPVENYSPAERDALYEQVWQEGAPFKFQSTFSDLRTSAEANATAMDFVANKIRETITDPVLADKLTPTYPISARRLCLDTNYYATYLRENVELVDVRERPIARAVANGLELSDGSVLEVDAIVLATGFDAITGALRRINIVGKKGRTLAEYWADSPHNFIGLLVSGFPNLFTVTGPSSPGALSNMVVSIEQHVDLIFTSLEMAESESVVVETTEDAQDAWARHGEQLANRTLFVTTDSWYVGTNVPGKPRVFLPYAGGVGNFRRICDGLVANGFAGFHATDDLSGVNAAIDAVFDSEGKSKFAHTATTK
jgi:cation diffusion facilitator CzcD-associated flavoprotein CzcO